MGDAAGAVVMLATFPAKLELSRVGAAVLLRRHGCPFPAVIGFVPFAMGHYIENTGDTRMPAPGLAASTIRPLPMYIATWLIGE